MNNKWVKSANNFFIREVSQDVKGLPIGVYKIQSLPTGELYLANTQESFSFPYKVYGIENKFIDRVTKTYKNTTGNLGILLNGVKGTGKTVTAKQICNKLQIPVIIVNDPYDNIPSFINNIQQEVIVFIDEYEKIYSDRDHSVLTIMDGVLDNGYRRVFLLTTNNLYINDNLLQRPGRIRYLKTYKDLSREVIEEIVDDKLIHKELRNCTVNFISELDTITVDIVKAVVEEVNIHGEDPVEFKDVFNIQLIDNRVNLYSMTKTGDTELIYSSAEVSHKTFGNFEDDYHYYIGDHFSVNGKRIGTISRILDGNTFEIECRDMQGKSKKILYTMEKSKGVHHSFLI